MAREWAFFAFDWGALTELEPRLIAAHDTGNFDGLNIEAIDDILEGLGDDAHPADVCNSLLISMCGVGDVVPCDSGLPERMNWLRRQPDGDDAADVLATLITREPNIQEWYRGEVGIVGLLGVHETADLRSFLSAYRARRASADTPVSGNWSRWFVPKMESGAFFDMLFDLVEKATADGHGLAVMCEE